jgi:Fe2+ or Zn2+ uptake regulation protein
MTENGLTSKVQSRIKQFGFRLTPQREQVLRAIAEQGEHATFDEIYARVKTEHPHISKATVYRTLETFSRYRLIHGNQIAGGDVYEVAGEDGHHHLICHKCWGDVKVSEATVRKLFRDLEKQTGFLVLGEHYIFMGLCPDCREKEGDSLGRFHAHPKFRKDSKGATHE